jgi:FK506-binding nuclear protein
MPKGKNRGGKQNAKPKGRREPEPELEEVEDIEDEELPMDDDLDMDDLPDEDLPSLFWSLTVSTSGKVAIEEPPADNFLVHITNACFGERVNNGSRTVVICEVNGKKVPICVLHQGTHENQPLDLLFSETANFELKGTSVSEVTLIGYLQPPPGTPEPMMDDEQLRAMDEMDEAQLRQKMFGRAGKKGPHIDADDNVDDEEPEEAEEAPGNNPPTKKRKLYEKGDESKQEEKETSGGDADTTDQPKKGQDGGVTLKNGISYKDMKQGSGKPIKNGQTVRVYYVGQLDDKSIFDKAISGDGFEFKVGSNDVIQGWNFGVRGMKVGGKRRVVIPPKFAYGAEGQPPKIPANAALTFTIEVRDVQ